jgi:hypothetical protein
MATAATPIPSPISCSANRPSKECPNPYFRPRAHHLRVLSFAEECALALKNADAMSGDEQAGAAAPAELAGG